MSKIGYLGSFAFGCGVGALTAWIFTKRKYDKLVESEIQSVKDEFSKNIQIRIVSDSEDSKDHENSDEKSTDLNNYKVKLEENHYTNYKQALEEVKGSVKKQEFIYPYPIEQDEQGETGFSTETVTWYEGDGTLADDTGRVLDLPDEVIGFDNLESFGDMDVIYVRNEAAEVDYEVIKDSGTYADAYSNPNYIQSGMDE